MTIIFEVWEDGGEFKDADAYENTVQELDHVLDDRDAGRLTSRTYVSQLRGIVERHPDFIDGYAHLGYALLDQGKTKLALDACLRGAAIGEGALPPDFRGLIEWAYLNNRPFFRAMHGVVLCQLRLGHRKKAISLMEKLLAWNPSDNLGIRYLIGPEYLRALKFEAAEAVFEANAAEYPPYRYELALLFLMSDNPVAAATSLRRGFVENLYIAETLTGNPAPISLAIWHGSNFAMPEFAQEYFSRYGDLWLDTPGAIAFVRWLYMHSKILAERAAILECQEELFWERDYERRGRILDREANLLGQMRGELSEEIVKKRPDRKGRLISPWLHGDATPMIEFGGEPLMASRLQRCGEACAVDIVKWSVTGTRNRPSRHSRSMCSSAPCPR